MTPLQASDSRPGLVKAYVINLERAVERQQQITAQLEAQGIPFSVFPAIDGSALDDSSLGRHYDAAAARASYREMTRGEVACALSHLGVYRQMLADGVDHALVLEDDARLGPAVRETLQALADRISADTPLVALLSHVDKYTLRGSRPLTGSSRLVDRYHEWWRAHGYFVTRAAAARMLEALLPVRTAADHWSNFEQRGIIDVKAVVPYCIGLSDLAEQSSLESHRSEKDAEDKGARRDLGFYLYRYGYRRFVHQIFVRPFLRVRRQRQNW